MSHFPPNWPEREPEPQVTCTTCGATGHPYFGGHDDPYAPHPFYTSTGSEGRCDVCGGPHDAVVHTAHGA